MRINNVVRGIGLVLVISILLYSVNALTVDSTDPSLVNVTNVVGDTRTFNLTVNESSNFLWYINGSSISSGITGTNNTSIYTNSTLTEGYWNITAVAVSVANGTINGTTWWWRVTDVSAPSNTTPSFTSDPTAINITDTSADIRFSVNQTSVETRVHYGVGTLNTWSGWKNDTASPITIPLSGLTKVTTYNYTVYAYNGSNRSLFTNSPNQSFTTVDPTAPNVNVTDIQITLGVNTASIAFSVNQSDAKTRVKYGTDPSLSPGSENWSGWKNYTPRTILLSGLNSGTTYHYSIYACNGTNESYFYNSSISNFTTTYPPPNITVNSKPSSLNATVGDSLFFNISVDQRANVTWKVDNDVKKGPDDVLAGGSSNYTFKPTAKGTYNVSVTASNTTTGKSSVKYWIITVHPKTYASGNRIWDGSKPAEYNLVYSWSPMSFYAFYYDVDDNVGKEELQITLTDYSNRAVGSGKLIYKTVPENVNFKYDKWGKYNVIGFMADKYFAGYTGSTIPDVDPNIRTLSRQQLHKVLMDDKDSHSLRASTTYPLGDGYALSLKDIGTGRVAMISISKDGGEVDNAIVEVGETYTYSKKVGSINDLPIIVLHIGTVFMGTTESMVQINGIFQISESYTSVNQNNNYGMMEISTVSDSGITMRNENSFTLSSGSTIDIMGDMKFIVANNDSVLRFAPMVKKTGEYEVRGTISNNETPSEWTPLSFEGFYYNIDEDIGTEKLTITRSSDTSRTVGIDNIEYSTSSALVSHKYSALGKYNVIGFMAEKYFAGYEVGKISNKVISTMGKNQLHKVLIDDDTQRIIYAGSTLTLNDGYVIKIKDVNMGAGSAEVWLSVLKDGNEVGDGIKGNGEVFTFEKDVGAVKELPIIALRIQNIFRGKEATAAFVKGTFQISESYKTVKQGDTFDKMKVNAVSANTITMKNPSVVSLDAGSSDTLMGNMRLKVADSTDIRYYPYILFNGSALAANQLAINVPSSMMVKDVITISITSGAGTTQDNAEVSFDGQVIGTTNSTGKLDYLLTKAGTYNFTATKLGFEKATKTVKIDVYVDNRLNFELPEFIDQYIPVSIIVRVSGTGNATSGADITFDGTSIGKTDSSGTLTYTFTSSGTHNLAASKPGFITVQREINVRLPFTEFKALDINFRPDIVNKGQNVYVWANITNTGTKEGMLPVALIINSTVVENSNITLAPGKNGEVNFSHKVELLPGNYTVEILGQKTTMPVKEEPLNLFLIAGIITVLGAISIFIMTSKEILSIEALKAKLNMAPATDKPVINTEAINRAINDIKSKSSNAINDIMSKFKKK